MKARDVFRRGRTRLQAADCARLATKSGKVTSYRLPVLGTNLPSPKVLVVHGWGSRSEYLVDLACGLQERGAEVVMLDLPGHGASSGRVLELRKAAEAIGVAEAHHGPFTAVVGHSFGGAAVTMAAGGIFGGIPQLKTRRLVVIGSPSNMSEVFNGFARAVGLGPASVHAMNKRVLRLAGIPVEALDSVAVSRRIDPELLVVHAEDDKEVPVAHAERFIGLSPKVQHVWANGHGHRRIVSAPEVISAIADFVGLSQEMDLPAAKVHRL
ncbi:alpha/beta hydrolase [Peteryoungia desertarenae]|nr:alpha/beta fold hydrolase [Peteryoungia desertarenae]